MLWWKMFIFRLGHGQNTEFLMRYFEFLSGNFKYILPLYSINKVLLYMFCFFVEKNTKIEMTETSNRLSDVYLW